MTTYLEISRVMETLMDRLGDMHLDPVITWDFFDGTVQVTFTLPETALAEYLWKPSTNTKKGSS